jgi:PAS domain S-box-containing protein
MPFRNYLGSSGESPDAAILSSLCWSVDSAGDYTVVNEAAAAFFGQPAAALLGTSWIEWVHPAERDACRDALSRTCETGQGFELEHRLRRHDGEYCWVINTTTPAPSDKPFFTTTCFEVTSLREAAERLRIFSLAAEQSPVSIIITNAAGDIEYVNPKFTAATGYSRDEVTGKNPRVLQSGEMPPEGYRAMWADLSAGREWRGEFHNRRKDGTLFWESAVIAPVRDSEGQITHYFAVKEDITENKRLAAMVAEAQRRAQAAQRAKSEFLSNMSHELRTPMNGILGMAYLLRDAPSDPERDTYLRVLSESTEALLAFMSQLLDLASLSEGAASLHVAPFDLAHCTSHATGLFAAVACEKGLTIETEIDAGVPSLVAGDSIRLGQVLANLVGNAVKFSTKGTITVTVGPDRSAVPSSTLVSLQFSMRDEGIGIPADKIDLIFDPFERADTSASRKYGGAGVGLAIARRLVEAMGGRIWAVSRPGHGSTFFFTAQFQPL